MLVALCLALQAGLTVSAEVDRERLPIGEELHYSLTAVSRTPGPFRVDLPVIRGLEVVERAERLDDTFGATSSRTYRLEVTFRATEIGSWRIGPVMVFHGSEIAVAPEIDIRAVGNAANDPNRNPRLLELIRRVPTPAPGAPAALVSVVSSPRIYQGDQLDVLTAAWFSRSLRGRLRRPPTLKPPVLAGVWTVSQPAVPGIVASRSVGDDVYDLFVSHQVAFPLTAGRLTVPSARLEYTVPVSRRASGDERPEATVSEPVHVEVLPLPDEARPPGFRGPTATGVRVGYRVRNLPGHAGEPLAVDVVVQGAGNLAFWVPPLITWPGGVRAYLDRTVESARVAAGVLGGTKTFHFLLVPDSVGSVALPEVSYQYFDGAAGRYREATSAGMVVPILPGKSRLAGRTPPPLVAARPARAWADELAPPGRLWLLGVLLPVLVLAGGLGWQRVRHRRAPAPTTRPDGIAALETVIQRLVPDVDRGEVERLARGLRRAGVPRDQASEAATLQLELDRIRFTPGDSTGIAALGRRAADVVANLPGLVRRRVGLVLLVLVAGSADGQTPRPETLYADGAYRPAADGFAARASAAPGRWEHHYNEAAARYLAGEDAEAAAALLTALRLAPRADPARALWNTLERQYEPLGAARPWPGLSRQEAGILSLGAWWLLLGLAVVFRRRRPLRTGLILAGLGGLVAAATVPGRPEPDRAFMAVTAGLRRTPHGLSAEQGQMAALTRVRVEQWRGDWALVVDRLGNRGWVTEQSLAGIDRVD